MKTLEVSGRIIAFAFLLILTASVVWPAHAEDNTCMSQLKYMEFFDRANGVILTAPDKNGLFTVRFGNGAVATYRVITRQLGLHITETTVCLKDMSA